LFLFFNSAARRMGVTILGRLLAGTGQLWGFGERRGFEPRNAPYYPEDLRDRAEPRQAAAK
jgi:hypothetical protein